MAERLPDPVLNPDHDTANRPGSAPAYPTPAPRTPVTPRRPQQRNVFDDDAGWYGVDGVGTSTVTQVSGTVWVDAVGWHLESADNPLLPGATTPVWGPR